MKFTGDNHEISQRYKQNIAPLDLNANCDSTAWLNKLESTSLPKRTKEYLKNGCKYKI